MSNDQVTPHELMNNTKYFVSVREVRHVSYEIEAGSLSDVTNILVNFANHEDRWVETGHAVVEMDVVAIALGGFVYKVSPAFPDGTDEPGS